MGKNKEKIQSYRREGTHIKNRHHSSKIEKKQPSAFWQLMRKLLLFSIFSFGLLLFTYPFYSNAFNQFLDEKRIEIAQAKEKQENEARTAKLKEENEKITKQGLAPGAVNFEKVAAKVTNKEYQKHLIGMIQIPSIHANVPVFDQTYEALLQIGATVVQGTSFPTGGPSTHSVISGHSGLPNRELFTNLEKVKIGDEFILTILGQTLAYQVDNIRVVKPDDTSSLVIEPTRDLVTLLTCTPYMINTDRLLVTGHRIAYTPKLAKQVEESKAKATKKNATILIGTGLFVLLALWTIVRLILWYLLRRTRFDLYVEVVDSKQLPLQAVSVLLYNRTGKQLLKREKQPFIRQSDEEGIVIFSNLPKDQYTLKIQLPNQLETMGKVGYKKIRQKKLSVFQSKKYQKLFVKEEKNMVRFVKEERIVI